ncbi:hypothetical protein ABT354_19440 [Streptomyces sp. NPDC000594]|uniref:hypothetical protein n=1 Tax=Streptomyces sp. NPDC000594 TaxID=3154261 RepID=UPI003332C0EB
MSTPAETPGSAVAVFTAPKEHADRVRMRRAHALAARTLGVTVRGREVWGWQGRTLSRRAANRWLRVVSAPQDKRGGKLWEGNVLADTLVPRSVPRPRVHDVLDWTDGGHAYRAELTEYIPVPTVTSGTPVLDRGLVLPDAWWAELKAALGILARVPTERAAVRQSWIDRNFERFLGIPPIRVTAWTTGHADVHWANLTHPVLTILDWEGWGRLPVGYDLGILHAYSLPTPAVAARIRHEFAHILDTPEGRIGELVALGQLLQASSRGVHPNLGSLLASWAEQLTGVPVPPHPAPSARQDPVP